MSLDNFGGKATEVVNEQHPPYQGDQETQFCGIFNMFTPRVARRCWLDPDHMVISCPQGETMRPVIIGLGDGSVLVPGDESCHGVVVTDVLDTLVVGVKSDPLTPPHLVVASLPAGPDMKFSPVSTPRACPDLVLPPDPPHHRSSPAIHSSLCGASTGTRHPSHCVASWWPSLSHHH